MVALGAYLIFAQDAGRKVRVSPADIADAGFHGINIVKNREKLRKVLSSFLLQFL
jgi:hypothetical protein